MTEPAPAQPLIGPVSCGWCHGNLIIDSRDNVTTTGHVQRIHTHCASCGRTWVFTITQRQVTDVDTERARSRVPPAPPKTAGVHPAALWGTDFYADLNPPTVPRACDSEPADELERQVGSNVTHSAHSDDMTDQSPHQVVAA